MNDKINNDWKSKGFNNNLVRNNPENPGRGQFIGGAQFDQILDDILFNRMIKLKNIVPEQAPQANELGKIYYDPTNKKYKMYIGGDAKWVDLVYTSTSTSTTSSSTSSTSSSSSSTSTTTT